MKKRKTKLLLLTLISALSSFVYFAAEASGATALRFADQEMQKMGVSGIVAICEDYGTCDKLLSELNKLGVETKQLMIIPGSCVYNTEPKECIVISCLEDNESIAKVTQLSGTAINRGHVARAQLCCVAGFTPEQPTIAVELLGRYAQLSILGEAKLDSRLLENLVKLQSDTLVLLVPQTTIEERFDYHPTSLVAFPEDEQQREGIFACVEKFSDGVKLNDLTAQRAGIEGLFRTISVVVKVLAGFSVLTCLLCTAAFVSLLVSGDRCEIGIKRAMGASERQIVTEYVAKSALVTACGTLFSAAVCLALNLAAQSKLNLELQVGYEMLCATAGVLLLSALVSSIAASRAAKNLPADSFRE